MDSNTKSFDHLIFQGDSFDMLSAISSLQKYNCIQIKNAIDIKTLSKERDSIISESRNLGVEKPGRQLLYSVDITPNDIESNLVNFLRIDKIFPILAAYLEAPEFVVPVHYASRIRRVTVTPADELGNFFQDRTAEPFHQDGRALDMDVFGETLVVWVLLAPDRANEKTAPALKLLPFPKKEILPIEMNPHHPSSGEIEICHETVEKIIADNGIWKPEIEFGDIILFSGFCPHGTLVSDEMTHNRLSAEIKLCRNDINLHTKFFRRPEINPNHHIVRKRFTIGPIELINDRELIAKAGRVENNLREISEYDLSYRYGRARDDYFYAVTNKTTEELPYRSKQPMVFYDPLKTLSETFIELTIGNHTGLKLISNPWSDTIRKPDLANCLIVGNRIFGIHKHLQQEVDYVTVLQDPVKRAITQIVKKLPKTTYKAFEEFIDRTDTLDILPQYFSQFYQEDPAFPRIDSPKPQKSDKTSTEMASQVKANIERHIKFVIIPERLVESLFLLFHKFGLPKLPLPRTFDYPKKIHKKFENLPSRIIRKLESKLELDLEIYQHHLYFIDQEMRKYDFGESIKEYQEDLRCIETIFLKTVQTIDTYEKSTSTKKTGGNNNADQSHVRTLRKLEKQITALEEVNLLQQQKIERMEISYTGLLRQHLEATGIIEK